jgi:uncharacterized protein (TIGR02611 family)
MKLLKRVVVTIVGLALLGVGIALMILPGPGILGIVAGLAVLATEYEWARRLLKRAKKKAEEAQRAAVGSPVRTGATFVFAAGLAGLGLAMVLVDDLTWPVLDDLIAKVWGPVTGYVLIATGLLLVLTTAISLRQARRDETAQLPERVGATALQQGD